MDRPLHAILGRWSLLVLGMGCGLSFRSVDAAVDFGRDVLPILSDKCYHCHGPDETARKAKLRLDTREGAFSVLDGKAIIAPGKSSGSELVRRVLSQDPEEVMPPPKAHRDLSAEQRDTLRRWVDDGARWGKHWSFESIPAKPELPTPQEGERNEIDRFVFERLAKDGLKPMSEASRGRLIRRLSFDLTGLPPAPSEVRAFEEDRSPDAYQRLVDRLLDSPAYGERMAAEWLDLARYADTHGYQSDRYRAIWPWRDWVIQAFNGNLPYDQFVTWQLAGDLLPSPTQTQRLATAFNRIHLQNEEGGIVEEEFRVSYVVDRVNTFGTAFLGLTLDCCRCHDHKYDPLTQKDYYQLFAMFQNIDESGQSVYFGDVMPVPTLLLSTPSQEEVLNRLSRDIGHQREAVTQVRANARSRFEEWLHHRPTEPLVPGLTASYGFDEQLDGHFTNRVSGGKPGNPSEGPVLTPGLRGQALELTGENGVSFPGAGAVTRADPFSYSVAVQPALVTPRLLVLHKSRAWMDAGSRGYELLLEDGRPAVGLHHMWPGNSLKVRSLRAIPTNAWTQITVTYDGSSRAAGLHLYLNGEPAEVEVVRDGLWRDFTYGGDEPELAVGYRFRDNGFKQGKVDELQFFHRELTRLEVAELAGLPYLREALSTTEAELTPGQRAGLEDYYLHAFDTNYLDAVRELTRLRQEQNRLIETIPDLMVMQEMDQPKRAHMLKRGAYDAPGDEVSANTPAFLPPLGPGQPRNRLGLAQWLTDPAHPLFARVTVNRAWQQMFGRGLVETTENFGTQGAVPTHPALLDWLAHDFIASGWNLKGLLRKIALSATYRQASAATPEQWARDPDNRWLGRGPARRLAAEMLRDQALAVSGLLSRHLGGPSVRPYQPEGLWESAANSSYSMGHGEDLHRRSLYTYWKRTVPPPAMITFDAAERNVCVVRRQSTSTPLQALVLLNDPQLIEAARWTGQRILREGGATRASQIDYAFRLVTGRAPSSSEVAVLDRLWTGQLQRFEREPEAATQLLTVGEAKTDAGLPPAELAATTILAQALLNHDEALMRR